MTLFTIHKKSELKVLRKKTSTFKFEDYGKPELRKLVQGMKNMMHEAQGIGLSANQIGISSRFFIAEINNKFYTIFNPKIEKTSKEISELEEGCLSVPKTYGSIKRYDKVTLTGFDIKGKKIKIKAWGLLAQAFQHEVDHLNGKLFTDKAKNISKVE